MDAGLNILLLGGGGQLGWELRRALALLGPLSLGARDGSGDVHVDLEQADSIRTALRALRPGLIVNAAGYNDVDRAEAEPQRAQRINAEAVAELARGAHALDAWLLHFSSDYVFDGSGSEPWPEDAAAEPLNAYGRSKLAGEQAVRASGCKHLILRSSWLHAPRGSSFVHKVLALARTRASFDVVDDQVGAPTSAELLADISAWVLRSVLRGAAPGGTYHAAASGQTSRHACAQFIIEQALRQGHALVAQPQGVRAVASSAYPAAAQRPLNSRLDCTRLCRSFDLHLPDWRSGITRTLAELPR